MHSNLSCWQMLFIEFWHFIKYLAIPYINFLDKIRLWMRYLKENINSFITRTHNFPSVASLKSIFIVSPCRVKKLFYHLNTRTSSVLALPKFVKGKSNAITDCVTRLDHKTSPILISSSSVSSTAWMSCSSLKLQMISTTDMSCRSHKSGKRVGSSVYPVGMENKASERSFRHSKNVKVTLAVTVGNTGSSVRNTESSLWC